MYDTSLNGLLDNLNAKLIKGKALADNIKGTGIMATFRSIRRSRNSATPAPIDTPPAESSNWKLYTGIGALAVGGAILFLRKKRGK